MAQVIDEEIRQMVDSNYQRAKDILMENMDVLHNMAHALLDWETIDKFQIDELMAGKKLAPPPEIEVSEVSANDEINTDADLHHEDDSKYGQPGQLAVS